MTTTKLGRRILGHQCSYECDCDDGYVELPFDGDPDECAFDSSHGPLRDADLPTEKQLTSAAIVVGSAVICGVILVLRVVSMFVEWMATRGI